MLEKEGYSIEPNKKFGLYEVDVYCPEIHAAFEYDGEGWHSFKSRDRRRDEYLLEQYELPVCRVRGTLAEGSGALTAIRAFAQMWALSFADVERRKLKWLESGQA